MKARNIFFAAAIALALLLATPFLLLFGTDDLAANGLGALALAGLMFL